MALDYFRTSAECREMAHLCIGEARRLHQFDTAWALSNRKAKVAQAGDFRRKALALEAQGR
jgi:hypothetical protein